MSEKTSLSVPHDVAERLRKRARKLGITIQEATRRALLAWLKAGAVTALLAGFTVLGDDPYGHHAEVVPEAGGVTMLVGFSLIGLGAILHQRRKGGGRE